MCNHIVINRNKLGLINPPNGSTNLNNGVETAPDILISYLKASPLAFSFTEITPPTPENISPLEYTKVIADSFKEATNLILSDWDLKSRLITLGGDHSSSFPSLNAILQTKESVGVVMFDSHGDLNTFESSPSGNFHGMWLRGLMSDFSQDQISTIAPVALKESDVFFVGNLILEDSEVTFTQEHSIKNIETNNPYDTSLLNDFISRFNHLHISFDIDVLNQSLAPATGTPNPNGLSLETAIPLLELCFNHSSWSFDLVEVNPEKDGAEETLENAEQILEILKRRLA